MELLEELKEEVFNWEKYLEDTGSKEVPSSVFKHVSSLQFNMYLWLLNVVVTVLSSSSGQNHIFVFS